MRRVVARSSRRFCHPPPNSQMYCTSRQFLFFQVIELSRFLSLLLHTCHSLWLERERGGGKEERVGGWRQHPNQTSCVPGFCQGEGKMEQEEKNFQSLFLFSVMENTKGKRWEKNAAFFFLLSLLAPTFLISRYATLEIQNA